MPLQLLELLTGVRSELLPKELIQGPRLLALHAGETESHVKPSEKYGTL